MQLYSSQSKQQYDQTEQANQSFCWLNDESFGSFCAVASGFRFKNR